MANILSKLTSENIDLKQDEILGILHLIDTNPKFSNTDLITLTGLPKQTLRSFKASIGALLEEPQSDELCFNSYGKELLSEVTLKAYSWRLVNYSSEIKEQTIKKLLEVRKKHNLEPKRELDQFFATAETSVDKALVLLDKGVTKNNSIAIFGDDDLVSVTLVILESLLNEGPLFNEILVLDIDQDVLDVVRKTCDEFEIDSKRVKTEIYDARKDLKPAFTNRYDVAMTDPPYTKSGVNLFLKRCMQLLKPHKNESGNYIFLCYGASFKEPYKPLKIQEMIQRANLLIEDKINKFNRYHGADSLGNASSLYILKTTPSTKISDDFVKSEIYTFEDISEEKFPYVDHFVFKLNNVPKSIITSKKSLLKACGEFCRWHRLKVVDTIVTKFKGGGFTITFVLANSNLVVHTWPEFSALHFDLVTCTPVEKKDQFAKNLHQLFRTTSIEIRSIE